jgi:hypothetical protein
MKPSYLLIPAALLLISGSVWLISLRVEGTGLSRELKQQSSNLRQATQAQVAKTEAESVEYAALTQRLAEVQEQLAIEQKTAADVAAQKAELQSRMPKVDDGEMVVSFGRIRDMASEMGEAVRIFQQMENRKEKNFVPEDQRATAVKMMSWMPEIAGFEDTPAEISSLQAGMIAKTFDLDPETTARVQQIISDHFAQMKAMGVTASSKDRPGWRDQRSASLTQLMWKLRPILPANSDAIRSLPLMLNMGTGMEKQVNVKVDEKIEPTPGQTEAIDELVDERTEIKLSLPMWPPVPWLPKEQNAPRTQ